MLLRQSPFRGEDDDEVYDSVLADEPLYPISMPRDSVSILQKLLTREPDQRLGSGPTDAQEVMSQPFFRNINWEDIYHKRVQPPFIPSIKDATDTSNFDPEFTSVTPVLTPVQSGKFCLAPMKASRSHMPQSYRKPCRRNSGAFLTRRSLSKCRRVATWVSTKEELLGRIRATKQRSRAHYKVCHRDVLIEASLIRGIGPGHYQDFSLVRIAIRRSIRPKCFTCFGAPAGE